MKIQRLLGSGIDAVLEFLTRIRVLGPVSAAKLKYFQLIRTWPDLKDPKDLNEKINWLKLYGDTSAWPMLADKYAVRDYVRGKGFGDNLVRLLGRWDRAEDIDWESLPDRFVMKCNNRSGDALICEDKSRLDGEAVKAHFAKLLRKKYGIGSSELHYSRIKPCIIAEELLDASTQKGSSSIIDYKIWCIDGEPKWLMCTSNRRPDSLERSIFDLDWNYHPEYIISEKHYIQPSCPLSKPENLEEMLHMAACLSEGFPLVRVDLYNVEGKVYFGEMTFTPAGGCMKGYTREFLLEKGAMVKLVPAVHSHQACKERLDS